MVDDRLLFSKRRHKSHRGFWDKVDSDDMSAAFGLLVKRQGNIGR